MGTPLILRGSVAHPGLPVRGRLDLVSYRELTTADFREWLTRSDLRGVGGRRGYVADVALIGDDLAPETCVVPSVPSSVAQLRRFAVDQCRLNGPAVYCDTVALLVSELETNALVHGHGDLRLSVRPVADGVRVEVRDDGRGMPAPRETDLDAEGGRGLALVDNLATRWGTDPMPQGKSVWFEIDA